MKELRKNRKITQEKLAELLELNQRQVTRIETGDNFPSADTLEKLCIYLDIHPKYLFEFDWQYKVSYQKTGTDNIPGNDSDSDDNNNLIDRIFSPGFSSLGSADYHAGSGIGLNMVKDRVNEFGGSIAVSTVAGKGTTFKIEIPIEQPAGD